MKKKALVFGVLVMATALTAADAGAERPAADGAVVRGWNDQALATVRARSASDAQAARLYAMVNVAMFDAVNGVTSPPWQRQAALVAAEGAGGDAVAAAATAAHDVLAALYPDRAEGYDARLASDLAGVTAPGQREKGREWGARVATAVLAARAGDGSTPAETQPAGSGVGVFRAAWSGVQFRNLAPFAIADPAAYVGSGPPALGSLDYAAAFADVKLVGNAAIPDPAKSATYQYWSLGSGTGQPPGAWIQVAEAVSESRALPLPDAARLFALESMAMADTVAPTYTTKFVHRAWRPTTAIREAADDGNPDTSPDPAWSARAGSVGSSPEYWSGHSSFSAAAATVLQGFFCADRIPFSLVTDSSTGGAARSYPSFSAAAAEAGRSRVVGGLHFEFSNQAGLAAGRAIGSEVLDRALLVGRGPTHQGECPL
jgi:hypothetical protein